MTALLDTIDQFGPAIYYGDRFRLMLEDHLLVIRTMTTNQIRLITDDDWAKLNRYVGDFYGFLTALNYNRNYHWTILRLNGYRSRFDLELGLSQLILPDWDYIDKLANLCKEKRS
jgi:hypothetical protein